MSSNRPESICSVIITSNLCDHFLEIIFTEHLTGSRNCLYIYI